MAGGHRHRASPRNLAKDEIDAGQRVGDDGWSMNLRLKVHLRAARRAEGDMVPRTRGLEPNRERTMTGIDGTWTDPDQLPCEAGPAEAFSSQLAPVEAPQPVNDIDAGVGPNSISVAEVFDSVCCGWPEPPTSQEFHEAVRVAEPDERQKLIIWTWIDEAPVLSWVSAWQERAYSWRMLAQAARNCGNNTYPRLRILNTFAERQELIPDDAVPWLERRPEVPGWEETLD